MAQLFTNNATSTLAADITDTATSLTVGTGAGAEFPNPTAPDYFLVTLESATDVEIVKVTARSGDVMTLVRAQEGTVAAAFATDDLVELRVTAATMTNAMVAPAQIYAGAMREIATVTTSGSQSSVTFSGIPGTYRDLRVIMHARSTAAAASVDTYVVLNGDTAANYFWLLENRFGNGNSAATGYARTGSISGSTASSNSATSQRIEFPSYQSAFRKHFLSENGIVDGSSVTNVLVMHTNGWWGNTGPITQMTFSLSSGNFVDGSQITLYGIGGEVGGASLNPIYTKYDPFCPPASPSSLDDEFNVDQSGTPSGWTLANGTGTIAVRRGRCVILPAATSSDSPTAIEKTLPAGNFTVATRLELNATGIYNSASLYLRNSTSGKAYALRLFCGPTNDNRIVNLQVLRYNSLSSFNAVSKEVGGFSPCAFHRIHYDGTTLFFSRSFDGVEFHTVFSEAAATWFSGGNLPDRAGIQAGAQSTTETGEMNFAFFRYFPTSDADIGRNIGVGSDGALVEALPLILHNQVI